MSYPRPTLTGPTLLDGVPEAFWSRVEASAEGCWIWTGSRTSAGYGNLRLPGGGFDYAHRVAYSALVGPIPEGLVLDHLCRVRNCVNPAHLEPVEHAVNVRRGAGTYGPLKTSCKRGHDMTDPSSVYRTPAGHARCRECARLHEADPDRMAASRTHARKQNELIGRAARALGLSKREYARLHGWGAAAALRVLGEVA